MNADYVNDWFASDEEALENLKDWMRDYDFDLFGDELGETIGLEDLEGCCFCDDGDRLVGKIDGSDLSGELTDKAEQVTKPSLADVKKEVAEKKNSVDHTGSKKKDNGR